MPDDLHFPVETSFRDTYLDKGYAFPLDVLTESEAASCRAELEALERRLAGKTVGITSQLNYPHVMFRFASRIVRHPRILDRVEQILGPDILVWAATFFIKEPRSESYVSWHQDLKFWGLDDEHGQVSAWVALGPVNRANGAMRFVPGSHKGEMYDHDETYADNNALSRGQEARVAINEDEVVHVELEPGQASFHHGKLLHASSPNRSDVRRVGLAINYIKTSVRQTLIHQDYAMLVRGKDNYGNFIHVPVPDEDLSDAAMSWHARILEAQTKAIFTDKKPGK